MAVISSGGDAPRNFYTSPRCHACNSDFRADIDRMLLAGETTRAVSQWLDKTHCERIAHNSLAAHKREHLKVMEEAQERLAERAAEQAEAAKAFDDAVAQKVNDVEMLEEVARVGYAMVKKLGTELSRSGAVVTKADVSLFTGAMKHTTEAIVAKHELLDGKKVNVNGHVSGIGDLFALADSFGADQEEGEPPT